ncbi:MAG: exosortase/archaeosortase family protein [Burkholderiales bacterium]|nr:exosortase/archaeosortase family protein [Opitutaceae bacterium]
MKEYWQKFTAALPMPFAGAFLVAISFWGFVAWDQSHWWSAKEDYGFGWLVPAFVAYVIHDRWSRITAAAAACAAPDSPRAQGAAGILLNTLAYGAMLGGAGLFLLGSFYRAGAGPSFPGTLAITLGTASLLLPLFFINTPESEAVATQAGRSSAGLFEDGRIRLLSFFVFPCLVWLVSAPMVSVIENNLSLFLLRKVTAVVFFVFDLLGMPIEQQGNVLVLPQVVEGKENRVGVAEACSGIRSLTACLFAGSFLASVFLDKVWKKIALVAAAMLFAVFTNLLRGIFLTSWAYNYGHEAIEGFVHDAAGYAVLGLTVVGLLCLLPIFSLRISFSDADDPDESAPPSPPPPASGAGGARPTASA